MVRKDITVLILPEQWDAKARCMKPRGRLYYYFGNFFHPLDLTANEPGIIAKAIREFKKVNKAMIDADRKDPHYKTLEELCDLKPMELEEFQLVFGTAVA